MATDPSEIISDINRYFGAAHDHVQIVVPADRLNEARLLLRARDALVSMGKTLDNYKVRTRAAENKLKLSKTTKEAMDKNEE